VIGLVGNGEVVGLRGVFLRQRAALGLALGLVSAREGRYRRGS